jgi:ribosome production factor 1
MFAVFKVTSIEFQKNIKHHAVATEHIPELILNNFDSKIGVKVGRLFASLFPQNP